MLDSTCGTFSCSFTFEKSFRFKEHTESVKTTYTKTCYNEGEEKKFIAT